MHVHVHVHVPIPGVRGGLAGWLAGRPHACCFPPRARASCARWQRIRPSTTSSCPAVWRRTSGTPHPRPTARQAAEDRAERAAAANPASDDQQPGALLLVRQLHGDWLCRRLVQRRHPPTACFCGTCCAWRSRYSADFEPAKWGQLAAVQAVRRRRLRASVQAARAPGYPGQDPAPRLVPREAKEAGSHRLGAGWLGRGSLMGRAQTQRGGWVTGQAAGVCQQPGALYLLLRVGMEWCWSTATAGTRRPQWMRQRREGEGEGAAAKGRG